MGLQFDSPRGYSILDLVNQVCTEIEADFRVFQNMSRVFATYHKNIPEQNSGITLDEYLEELDEFIEKQLNLPIRRQQQAKDRTGLISVLKRIYRESNFTDLKAKILERLVYKYGPFSSGIQRVVCYIEPSIKDNGNPIANTGALPDCVFYSSDSEPIEFVECKATIANVIPRNLPIGKMKRSDQRKVAYLVSAYEYLRTNYVTPEIYFACYDSEYDEQLENVQKRWGYNFIKFINAEEIIERVKEKGLIAV